MPNELLDIRMHDGSRHFGSLPQTVLWQALRDHIDRMPGVTVTSFVSDFVTEAWIDFTYRGQEFSVNDQFGDYWFFVKDPACPDVILDEILNYSQRLLSERP